FLQHQVSVEPTLSLLESRFEEDLHYNRGTGAEDDGNNTDSAEDDSNKADPSLLSIAVTPIASCSKLHVVVAPSSGKSEVFEAVGPIVSPAVLMAAQFTMIMGRQRISARG
ncbi:hypothetical protein PIB30_085785, partial [Stylosanthes scabra]|nr:hypothetical protein [Stylosanthes scabra]